MALKQGKGGKRDHKRKFWGHQGAFWGAHLLLGEVLVALGLLHPKLVVHLLAPLADVLALAQVVDVGQPLLGLPLGLAQDVFDLGVVLPKKTAGLGSEKVTLGSRCGFGVIKGDFGCLVLWTTTVVPQHLQSFQQVTTLCPLTLVVPKFCHLFLMSLNFVTSPCCPQILSPSLDVPPLCHLCLMSPTFVTSSWCPQILSPLLCIPKFCHLFLMSPPSPPFDPQHPQNGPKTPQTQHQPPSPRCPHGATTGPFPAQTRPLPPNFWGFLGSHRVHQQLGAEEADAAQDFHGFAQKAHVEHGLGQLDVTKVAGTLRHVPWGHPKVTSGDTPKLDWEGLG